MIAIDTILFVHPALWAKQFFKQSKDNNCRVFSIVTDFESTHIDEEWLKKNSDYFFKGSKHPEDDFAEIKKLMDEHHLNPVAVINGIDSALVYTDYLQKALLGYDIDLSQSQKRLNKHQVNECLLNAGVPAIESVEITSVADFEQQRSKIESFSLPIIAKPSEDTAAMAGFEVLDSFDKIPDYLDRHLGKQNKFYNSQIVSKIIIQPYIPINKFGEYYVDFISFAGKHHCVGVGEYKKDKNGVFRQAVAYAIEDNPEIKYIIDYTERVLNAMEVKFGFTHNELFWDSDQKVFLIESNTRHAGTPVVQIYDATYCQRLLDQYLGFVKGDKLDSRIEKSEKYAAVLFLYNYSMDYPDKIYLEGISCDSEILSFRGKGKKKINSDFYQSYDRLQQLAAMVLLIDSNQDNLKKNISTICQREKDGILFTKG
ncbi:MAG: hypothetical protein AAGA27_04040 [Pseudomonadota bacterium]